MTSLDHKKSMLEKKYISYLRQITDGSLDDVEFPDSSLEVKEEEGEDYELPEGNLSRGIDNKTVR